MQTKHLFVLIHIRNKGKVGTIKQVKLLFTYRSKAVLLLWIIFVIYDLCHAVLPVHYSLVVTCWERANLLALLYVVFSSAFYHSPMWCPGSGVVLDCIDS